MPGRAPESRPAARGRRRTSGSAGRWRLSARRAVSRRAGRRPRAGAGAGAPRSRTPAGGPGMRGSSRSGTSSAPTPSRTGHTRDDQAETFLLQLIRGAGPRGLAGISPTARPRLPSADRHPARASCRSGLEAGGFAFREDESNRDLAFTRNRVGISCCRCCEREFSPGSSRCSRREAAIARQDEDRLQAEAIELAASVVLA